jgi:hypothetical protein
MATLNYVGDGKEAKTLEVSDKAARQIQYAINNSDADGHVSVRPRRLR